MTPQEIVSELDRHIVGQHPAKRAVAIALRNRWRRQQVAEPMRSEITPKNILMIGPTGVGKTEIARRLAQAGRRAVHQGRGHQVHRSRLCRQGRRQHRARPGRSGGEAGARAQIVRKRALAEDAAEERVLDILVPPPRAEFGIASGPSTDNTARQVMRKRLREGSHERPRNRGRPGRCAPGAGDPRPAGHGGDGRAAEGPVLADGPGQAQDTQAEDRRGAEAAGRRRSRQAGQRRRHPQRGAGQRRGQRHRLHRRDRQGGLAQRTRRRRGVAPGRAARPAAAGRGHVGAHQVRHGQDRPHPVHRLGRLPCRQAQRPDSRTAGALPDPRRTAFARRRATSRPSSPAPTPAWSSSTRRCWPPKA